MLEGFDFGAIFTATGLAKRHQAEQAALIAAALGHDTDNTRATQPQGAVAAE